MKTSSVAGQKPLPTSNLTWVSTAKETTSATTTCHGTVRYAGSSRASAAAAATHRTTLIVSATTSRRVSGAARLAWKSSRTSWTAGLKSLLWSMPRLFMTRRIPAYARVRGLPCHRQEEPDPAIDVCRVEVSWRLADTYRPPSDMEVALDSQDFSFPGRRGR